MNYLGLILALFLPWILGVIWLRVIWSWKPGLIEDHIINRDSKSHLSLYLGNGYFLGIIATTLLMRIWDVAGFEQNFMSLSLVILDLIGGGVILGIKNSYYYDGGGDSSIFFLKKNNIKSNKSIIDRFVSFIKHYEHNDMACDARWKRIAFWLFFALTSIHLIFYGLEIIWRPLFPWDAWMNWAPKARVWYELMELAPYVSPHDWFNGESLKGAYTLLNWKYPPTVPLIQLWTAMGGGVWEESLMNLPWLFCLIAFSFGFYGYVRLLGITPVVSMIFVYMLVSLPFAGVHTALAGYAEPWLAACYGLAAMAMIHWARTRNIRHALVAILLAVACSQIKIPGIVWMFTFVPAFLIVLIPSRWLWVAFFFLVLIVGLIFTKNGLDIQVPFVGQIVLTTEKITIPGIVDVNFQYHNVWRAFAVNEFVLSSWNLFWYLWWPVLIAYLFFGRGGKEKRAVLSLVVMGLAFMIIVFFTTRYFLAALDYSTINRATYNLVPLFLFIVAMFYSVTADQHDNNNAGREDSGAAT